MRSLAFGLLGLGVVLLALGFVISSDVLGFLFMICLVLGVILLLVDLGRRRSASG